jgi:hypothetical protein
LSWATTSGSQRLAPASAYVEYRSAPTNTSAQQSKKGELPKCCPQLSILSLKDGARENSEGLSARRNPRISRYIELNPSKCLTYGRLAG